MVVVTHFYACSVLRICFAIMLVIHDDGYGILHGLRVEKVSGIVGMHVHVCVWSTF